MNRTQHVHRAVPDTGPPGAVSGAVSGAVPGRAAPGGHRPWAGPAAVGLLTSAATLVLAVRSPYETGSYGVCPLLAVTGLWCPGCGGLRAVHALTQLDLAAAWGMNPLFVVGAPLLVLAWGLWLARSLGRGPSVWGRATWPAWAFLVVSVLFAVLRNVPALEPWLAPV
ncbi:membrane protein [Actinotalea ferrariae CF5-4]|uniref:Membrane protein n=1 Tax=Actinotalea ferrariae CF5-4 TaxID=948458 RepID=A0A021VY72_9CELL|nr:DUF2752 domain-containing protein [Actinotalea ferrariae]EYR64012.1 membrane protein [Actinotalea ferrariae CF5-4]